jgi:transposase
MSRAVEESSMMNVMSKPTEVSPKAQRRRYATSEKLRVLREADACAGQKGALSALLRREGLYSSHLAPENGDTHPEET